MDKHATSCLADSPWTTQTTDCDFGPPGWLWKDEPQGAASVRSDRYCTIDGDSGFSPLKHIYSTSAFWVITAYKLYPI